MIQHVFKPSRRRNGKRVVSRIWWGQYRLDGDTTVARLSLRTTEKRVAEKRLTEIVREKELERAGIRAPVPLREAATSTLSDHLDAFVADLEARGRSSEYVRHVRSRIESLIAVCGWEHVRDVTTASFIDWRAGQIKSPKTLNDYLDAPKSLLEWLRRSGRILENPLEGVSKAETRGRRSVERRAFTDEEMRRLLKVAGPRRPLYLTAVHTGLRRGELRQLVWRDVVLEGSRPYVRVRASTTKNRKDALIWLTGELARELDAARPSPCDPAAAVFPTMPSHHTLARELERAGIAKVDGSSRKVDFHALRHTFATNLHRAGVAPRITMELMRHRDPRLTALTYADVNALPTAPAVGLLPHLLDDAQLDAQTAGTSGQKPSPADPSGESGRMPQLPVYSHEKHDPSHAGTTGQQRHKSGAGGNRTPVPKQSASRVYTCSRYLISVQ